MIGVARLKLSGPMAVSQLKHLMHVLGIDPTICIEKYELVDKLVASREEMLRTQAIAQDPWTSSGYLQRQGECALW